MSTPTKIALLIAGVACVASGAFVQTRGAFPRAPRAALGAETRFAGPARGFVSSQPAENWEQGLLSGNGSIGASVLGQPIDEIVVFSHKRMFVPERAPILPPRTGERLFEIRRLIDRGLYAQASQLAADIGEQKGFVYPDPLMPAFDLRLKMGSQGPVGDYARSTNFETGETLVHWTDARGAFERRLFVSRADGIAVMKITGSAPGTVDCRLALAAREPDNKRFLANVNNVALAADPAYLTYRNGFVTRVPGQHPGARRRGTGRGEERQVRPPRTGRCPSRTRTKSWCSWTSRCSTTSNAPASTSGKPRLHASRPTTPGCSRGTRPSTAPSSRACVSTSVEERTAPSRRRRCWRRRPTPSRRGH